MKRPFYIIGHNPNTVKDATECLIEGANALEPDICFHPERPEKFFVYDSESTDMFANLNERILTDYLSGLVKALQSNPKLNLALISFDIKTPTFDINNFFSLVKQFFSDKIPGVAIIATVATLKNAKKIVNGNYFLNQLNNAPDSTAVGIDGDNDVAGVNEYFNTQPRYIYANGITPFAVGPKVFHSISEALEIKTRQNDGNLKMVYSWGLNEPNSMKDYINLGVDGLLTDNITKLYKIITTEYSNTLQLATPGFNPFTLPATPCYILTVKTANKPGSWTDGRITFRLKGSNGFLETTINALYEGMFEDNATNNIVLYGEDIGIIESLSVRTDGRGRRPNWLASAIIVKNSTTGSKVAFTFNTIVTPSGVTKNPN